MLLGIAVYLSQDLVGTTVYATIIEHVYAKIIEHVYAKIIEHVGWGKPLDNFVEHVWA